MKSEILLDKEEYIDVSNELQQDRNRVESNFKLLNETRNKLSESKSNDFLPNILVEIDELCKKVEKGFLNDLYTIETLIYETNEVLEETDKKLANNMNEIPARFK